MVLEHSFAVARKYDETEKTRVPNKCMWQNVRTCM